MNDSTVTNAVGFNLNNGQTMAKPLYIQRLEASLNIEPFMTYAQEILAQPLSSSEESDSDVNTDILAPDEKIMNGIVTSKCDRQNDKLQIYNLSQIGPDRKWLQDILLSDTETEPEPSDEDEYIRDMLKEHVKEKKVRAKYYQNPHNSQYGYYGASILSNVDMYHEHQRKIVGITKKKKEKLTKTGKYRKSKKKRGVKAENNLEPGEIVWDDDMSLTKDDSNDRGDFKGEIALTKKQRKKNALSKTPEAIAARRRKLWILMAKKELGKVQRAKVNNHKEIVSSCKRISTLCMKTFRQKAMQSQKNMKETIWRAKRLTREMQGYWKRYDRVERETKRRMEKEAEEQRKMDIELIEAKRQQRKLNFLITQTELYAHFMSKKLGKGTEEEQLRILNQLDEEVNPRLAALDDYNSDKMKQLAQRQAKEAFQTERERTKKFDTLNKQDPLYDQGISGILADEMGLGKTVQSIAFLCHIAEHYGVWGPFLIISPASTLHNWQQEMQRFVPDFNVVPYWGSPNERKILRQFWEQKDLHTKEASFHVVITSYQLIVSDYKYFNRIKWQYMILDEAQAIKSSSSVRWKLLLGFNCRNRLLLSGTPIQNSMAELWALLHFIMPTLFDSHDEFNEWFSKDIESHAENKTGIDEKQISRLHMILKPFMLRRIKKDVENELSDKIEIMIYCPLTMRQNLLYLALKKKIRIEDLLQYTDRASDHVVDKNFTSNLMNLVMQFRKVCNHPDLFERRDAKSPFFMKCLEYPIARLIYENSTLQTVIPSKEHLLYNRFNMFKAENVQRSLFPQNPTDREVDYENVIDLNLGNSFSFSRFCDWSPQDLEDTHLKGTLVALIKQNWMNDTLKWIQHAKTWNQNIPSKYLLLTASVSLAIVSLIESEHSLIFTRWVSAHPFFTFTEHIIHSMAETIEHRIIRSKSHKKMKSEPLIEEINEKVSKKEDCNILPEHHYIPRPPRHLICEPTALPAFVADLAPKVQSTRRKYYVDSREASWLRVRNESCESREAAKLLGVGFDQCRPSVGWSNIQIPDKQALITDSGKLSYLDGLLKRLKAQNHRVLIYSQMTRVIDLLEEYMWHRKHRYMRLDGSSKISARRDMVADFQKRDDIFVFLLSTRAGGLGINLTAADTVIFYDSDWNPTVDQQAMDRAHRLGQTKQVTVYRLICKGTIEERILQRAREKSEIQRMVISGGNFKPDTLKPKEVVSLLLDDEEIELKYRQRNEEKKRMAQEENMRLEAEKERKRKALTMSKSDEQIKKFRSDKSYGESSYTDLSEKSSPAESLLEQPVNYESSSETVVVDCDSLSNSSSQTFLVDDLANRYRKPPPTRGAKRGRPRGSKRGNRGGLSRDAIGTIKTPAANESSDQSYESTINPNVNKVRRGPGRPRLKPNGPSNQGNRHVPKYRKPMAPLVVPLGSSPAPTPTVRSPAMSPERL
ncbi:chromatin-remodeling ATPase INO80 isoform X2 [Sitodiplosis mosellana]|uniref:chromatin-remodeling ATPase INO80 isoform X2 n=1 Tax=Sitodiplosis mosellana TaxID=263140 RepID=UPI002443EE5C|nr:chromatin-remodeling ATPase INO80 isoform X2 [Sitodiplosis mosellana]